MTSLTYKVALVGEPQAGKSAFLAKLLKGSFDYRYQPTSVEFLSMTVELPLGHRVTLQLWDVGGRSPPAMLKTYLAQSQAVLAMYDVTSTQSFAGVLRWLDRVKAAAGAGLPYLALVACKSDLEAEKTVTLEDHQHLAHTLGMYSYSTSSLTGDGIKACAYRVAADLAGIPLSTEQLEALAGPSRELPARGSAEELGLPHPSDLPSGPWKGLQSGSRGGQALALDNFGVGAAAGQQADPKRRPMLSRGTGGASGGSRSGSRAMPEQLHLDSGVRNLPSVEQQVEDAWGAFSAFLPQEVTSTEATTVSVLAGAPGLAGCAAAVIRQPPVSGGTLQSKLQVPAAVPGVCKEDATASAVGCHSPYGATHPITSFSPARAPDTPRSVARCSPPDLNFDPRLPVVNSPCHSPPASPAMHKPFKGEKTIQPGSSPLACKVQVDHTHNPNPPALLDASAVGHRGTASLWACCFRARDQE